MIRGGKKFSKRGLPLKGKIKVDLSQWDAGDWGFDLKKQVEVSSDGSTVTIEIGYPEGEQDAAALKIAREAIEVFLSGENEYVVAICKTGLRISSIEETKGNGILVPWSAIDFHVEDWEEAVAEFDAMSEELNKWLSDQRETWQASQDEARHYAEYERREKEAKQ